MNDYIDDLWCYFSEGLSLVHEEKKFSCFFSDQPIEVKFIPLGNKVQIVVNCHDEVKVNVDKNDFLLSMSEHARAFFHRLMEIEPSSKESITYAISYLDKIKF